MKPSPQSPFTPEEAKAYNARLDAYITKLSRERDYYKVTSAKYKILTNVINQVRAQKKK